MNELRPEALLDRVVRDLAAEPQVEQASVWLKRHGSLRGGGGDLALQLAASAGNTQRTGPRHWPRGDLFLDQWPGSMRRIETVAASGLGCLVNGGPAGHPTSVGGGDARPIFNLCAQPLTFRQQVLGVLGVFSREHLDNAAFHWLRVVANHTAAALASQRAYAELERVRHEATGREELSAADGEELLGDSKPMCKLRDEIALVAATNATVLIEGESGVGKEMVARALHRASERFARPMVSLNCAAVPKELFESELFGHVKGAFTGALRDRAGRFQLAHQGTLFLDELAELPLELQPKLLRVLQEGQFERVGEESTRRVDVRMIAATNRDLKQQVERNEFRNDLYYRLCVYPIVVPPLRERKQDIPLLAAHLASVVARRLRLPEPELRGEDAALLQDYDWPGNVRQLRNVIERAVILSGRGVLSLQGAMPTDLRAAGSGERWRVAPRIPAVLLDREIRELELKNAKAALERAGGRVSGPGGAAALLGIPPTTLRSRLRAWNLAGDAESGEQGAG